MKRLSIYALVLALFFLGYRIAWAEHIKATTGILSVKAFSPAATISVSQQDHQIVNLRGGTTKLRLAPGNYQIIATDGQMQSTSNITIKKGANSSITLPAPVQKQAIEDNSAANSLIQLLPYTGPNNEYSISFTYAYNTGVATPQIVISAATDQAKGDAVAWIKSVGFDPNKMTIQYTSPSGE